MHIEDIEKKLNIWLLNVEQSTSLDCLDKIKSDILGKSGELTSAFKMMGTLGGNEKKIWGESINKVKVSVEHALKHKKNCLQELALQKKLASEKIDVTLPVANAQFGSLHLLTHSIRRIRAQYNARGFQVLDGQEIDSEFFNFDALNIPKHHPARQSHDTFYLKNFPEMLLRTHTSTSQIRTMQSIGLPVKMISIGKTYRNDCLDSTHSPMFHQIECLVAARQPICLGQMKSELKKFLSFFFETDDIAMRFRPSFFPFTEPGVEVDCKYKKIAGKLVMCSEGDHWMEIGGAGMVHPNVFRNCGIEGDSFGFAFGIGLERLVMLKYGIQDIRTLFETDARLLKHYA